MPLPRLANQRLIGKPFQTAEEVVDWLVAVQAQDFAGSKWGIAQRTQGATNADLDHAFNTGQLVRTHVLRPTWHFVRPADIRWLLALTAPRVQAINAYYYRQTNLDGSTLAKSADLIAKALSGNKHLTRPELSEALKEGGIEAKDLRLTCVVMNAELEGVICSGSLRGKQFTYALMDEWVAPNPPKDQEEALAELARRFTESRGPITAQDLAYWSGLTVADAKRGLEMNRSALQEKEGSWTHPSTETPILKKPVVHLLPNYDEYISSYKDPVGFFEPAVWEKINKETPALQAHLITRNGNIIGGWKRTLTKKEALIHPTFLTELNKEEKAALEEAANNYSQFLNLPTKLQ